ncbi:anti-sigma F factor antagonist [Jeotgalibacillus proteolyticus]|uniref:Anti-sigma F factor antagonist n=1 Tax=Jeotgalibacillus proteolyticus TaxID=2082395 RepID=A0A2S5GEH0_9BACL|nr:anti-sigma F factor antagonist [Jeotgalibacillus proteolyticus]PPA71311.1 anti-sigma F factor antagonist [Jeotgalibacillus proteolyticus]
MAFTVQAEIKKDVLLLRMQGELDHHATEKIREELLNLMDEHDIHHLVLNLSELEFMDSSGLGLMLGRYKHLQKKNGSMIVCAISEPVKRLFEMSGLFRIMIIETSEDHALMRLGVA